MMPEVLSVRDEMKNEMLELSEEDFNNIMMRYIADGMYEDEMCPFAAGNIHCTKYAFDTCTNCDNYYE